MFRGWQGDLSAVMLRMSRIATGASSLRVISARSRLALALPADRRAALLVAELYQPQRLKGRVFRLVAKGMIQLGIAKRFPSFVPGAAVLPRVAWLRDAAAAGSVGFLGCNPNHGLRCVLAGLEPATGERFIAKLGFGKSAAAVSREHQVLSALAGRWPGVVATLGLERGEWEAAGEVEEKGGPVEPEAWALLRLPHLGEVAPRSMADPGVRGLLASWLGSESVPVGSLPWASALLDRVPREAVPPGWHERIRSHGVRKALLHGDFAVWNLRKSGGGMVALDWEWGKKAGSEEWIWRTACGRRPSWSAA